MYLRTLTVYRVNPPPVLGNIETVASVMASATLTNMEIEVSSELNDDDDGIDDTILSSISATKDGAPLAYGVAAYEDNGTWYWSFSPSEAGVDEGDVEITITPHGDGGDGTSQSFTITVVPAGSPPTIDPIAPQSALTKHELSVLFTVTELDGDVVETNAICATVGVAGTYGINNATGSFTYTPDVADAALAPPIRFGIVASDAQGAVTNYFNVTVGLGSKPDLGDVTDQTVAFGGTSEVTLALTATDGDPITATNVQHVADAPAGDYSISNLVFRFVPASADIGKTFKFNVSATDIDGTTNVTFDVAVDGIPTPVLKYCNIDDWTLTFFTPDIETLIAGAEGYTVRYTHFEPDGTEVTQTTNVPAMPCVVNVPLATDYTYDVRAYIGEATSDWSNQRTVSLHKWFPATPCVIMKGTSRGFYEQHFDTLPSSGSKTWYDARTIPGWYAGANGRELSQETDKIMTFAWGANNTADGFYSFATEQGNAANRGLGAKNASGGTYCQFGVAFTNECRYAVTNLNVAFSAWQFRNGTGTTQLNFEYRKIAAVEPLDNHHEWKTLPGNPLNFKAPKNDKAGAMAPVSSNLVANVAFTGSNAVQPGEVIMIKWYVNAGAYGVPVGIDDLMVRWDCAWPGHTIISVR